MSGLIVLFAFGSLMAGIGGAMMWRRKKLQKDCTARVDGTVSDIKEMGASSKGKQIMYVPVFTYSVKGVEYVKRSNHGSIHCQFSLNQRVTVFYDPSAPKRYYVLGHGNLLVERLFIAFGVAFIIIGIAVLTRTQW